MSRLPVVLDFSGMMRACCLNPNYDTGPFTYHLSTLVNLNVIEKIDCGYRLTEFGRRIVEFILTVERKSLALFKSPQTSSCGEKARMKEFTIKNGRKVIIRPLDNDELDSARQLFIQTFKEDKYPLPLMQEKHLKYPSLFIGCFDGERIVGTIFGWPDYLEYPKILVVKAIVTAETHRRKGIATKLLKVFEEAAVKEGYERLVLGAEWEAVPFYISYGLDCFANIQITLDNFPWKKIRELKVKYEITGAVIFGPSVPTNLISKLNRELKVKVKSVAADFESISIQIKPKIVSKKALEETKNDFKAYATRFAFRKELPNSTNRSR